VLVVASGAAAQAVPPGEARLRAVRLRGAGQNAACRLLEHLAADVVTSSQDKFTLILP